LNLSAEGTMVGNGQIANCLQGLAVARGSTGWLDPAVKLTNVSAPTRAALGGQIRE
jgi:hypothetical protein